VNKQREYMLPVQFTFSEEMCWEGRHKIVKILMR